MSKNFEYKEAQLQEVSHYFSAYSFYSTLFLNWNNLQLDGQLRSTKIGILIIKFIPDTTHNK